MQTKPRITCPALDVYVVVVDCCALLCFGVSFTASSTDTAAATTLYIHIASPSPNPKTQPPPASQRWLTTLPLDKIKFVYVLYFVWFFFWFNFYNQLFFEPCKEEERRIMALPSLSSSETEADDMVENCLH